MPANLGAVVMAVTVLSACAECSSAAMVRFCRLGLRMVLRTSCNFQASPCDSPGSIRSGQAGRRIAVARRPPRKRSAWRIEPASVPRYLRHGSSEPHRGASIVGLDLVIAGCWTRSDLRSGMSLNAGASRARRADAAPGDDAGSGRGRMSFGRSTRPKRLSDRSRCAASVRLRRSGYAIACSSSRSFCALRDGARRHLVGLTVGRMPTLTPCRSPTTTTALKREAPAALDDLRGDALYAETSLRLGMPLIRPRTLPSGNRFLSQ